MFKLYRLVPFKIHMAWLTAKEKRLNAESIALAAEYRDFKKKKDNELFDLLHSQMGMMTMAWASLEMTIDMIIHMIHRRGGSVNIQPDLPKNLKQKLIYIRKIPKQICEVSHLDLEINQIIDRIHCIKELRHDITHGFVKINSDDYTLNIRRFKMSGSNLSVETNIIAQRDITAATGEIMQLYNDSSHLACAFAQVLSETEYEKVFRDIMEESKA